MEFRAAPPSRAAAAILSCLLSLCVTACSDPQARQAERPAPAAAPRSYESRAARCRSEFTMDRLTETISTGALKPTDKTVEVVSENAWRYYECRAYAEDEEDRCAALKWYQWEPRGHDRVELCREVYRKMKLARAVIAQDPLAGKLCERMYAGKLEKDGMIREGAVPQTCAIIVADKDPASVCRQRSALAQRPFSERQMNECLIWQSARVGVDTYCGLIAGKEKKCHDFVSFRTAFEARDPERCGASAACRVMMGGGRKACAGYAEEVKDLYCRARAAGAAAGAQ